MFIFTALRSQNFTKWVPLVGVVQFLGVLGVSPVKLRFGILSAVKC